MSTNPRRYLELKADLAQRPLVARSLDSIDIVVVIPALAEKEHLFRALESLRTNPREDLAHTLVVCVINNRKEPHASPDQIANNCDTLSALDELLDSAAPLRLAYIDAASPGNELPENGGVGLARKIGLDHALALLNGHTGSGALVCLDADTVVDHSYLPVLRNHFRRPDVWAAVVDYAHPDAATDEETRAIVCYELFLRYHVLALAGAGSPYAFPTIGSTMACSPDAYVAVAGMNQRQAGEDFYFLQQLAKTGPVRQIFDTIVHPSPRPSPRVPFGTGQRVRRHLAGAQDEYRLYDPKSYEVLRRWLEAVQNRLDAPAVALLGQAHEICPALAQFLDQARFLSAWPGLQKNAPTHRKLIEQFHRWFDGFKTIKLLHHLRDTTFPDTEMFSAIRTIAGEGVPAMDPLALRNDLPAQKAILERLRALQRNLAE